MLRTSAGVTGFFQKRQIDQGRLAWAWWRGNTGLVAAQKRPAEAIRLAERSVELREKVFGADQPELLESLKLLAELQPEKREQLQARIEEIESGQGAPK